MIKMNKLALLVFGSVILILPISLYFINKNIQENKYYKECSDFERDRYNYQHSESFTDSAIEEMKKKYQNSDFICLARDLGCIVDHSQKIPSVFIARYEILYNIKGDKINNGCILEIDFITDYVRNEEFIYHLRSLYNPELKGSGVSFIFLNMEEVEKSSNGKVFKVFSEDTNGILGFGTPKGEIFWKFLYDSGWRKQQPSFF